jgi:hypothetical protein
MNLADTQSQRPPAARGGQQTGHTWDFSDVARVRTRPNLNGEGARGLYLAVIENALTECRRFGREGFVHVDPHGWRGRIERHEYEILLSWLLGAPAPVTLQYCCDVLGLDATYVGQGMIRIAQRLGRPDVTPVYVPVRRYLSRAMRVVET